MCHIMKRLLDKRTTKITSSTSPLTFETTGGGSWEIWDRFIAVNGQNIYHIGNFCGTCSFFFEKIIDKKNSINPKEAIEKLNFGLASIDDNTIDILNQIIPNGSYEIVLLTIKPKYTTVGQASDYFANEQVDLWGFDGPENVPYSPKVNYYRGTDKEIGEKRKLFEFFVPLTSPDTIDQKRVDFYKDQILKDNKPTAICLTILDVKEPAVWPDSDIKPEFTSHWCVAHYILDGHHKIKAASDLNSEITLLSFVAVDKGVSTKDDLNEFLNILDGNENTAHNSTLPKAGRTWVQKLFGNK